MPDCFKQRTIYLSILIFFLLLTQDIIFLPNRNYLNEIISKITRCLPKRNLDDNFKRTIFDKLIYPFLNPNIYFSVLKTWFKLYLYYVMYAIQLLDPSNINYSYFKVPNPTFGWFKSLDHELLNLGNMLFSLTFLWVSYFFNAEHFVGA